MNSHQSLLIKAVQEALDRLAALATYAITVEQAARLNEVFLAASAQLQKIVEDSEYAEA